jgi:hypothetical protein
MEEMKVIQQETLDSFEGGFRSKKNRNVVIALNHLRNLRRSLEAQDRAIQQQLVEIDAAILALE